jgi:hypothetical protein
LPPCAGPTFTRIVEIDDNTPCEVRRMLNSYEMLLLWAAEQRAAELRAEAASERLAASVRPRRSRWRHWPKRSGRRQHGTATSAARVPVQP